VDLVAVDCEMVMTEAGSELARLSVVDQSARVLLDVYVQPELPVVDYVTQYSGITSAILASPNTLTLQQARIAFLRIVTERTLVAGHSVDSDMKALKIMHNRFLDTALLYPHPKGFPLRLKLSALAHDHLHLDIQNYVMNHRKWRAGSGNAQGALERYKRIQRGETDRDKGSGVKQRNVGELTGHSSVEDARAALALVQLKARRGLSYGLGSSRGFHKSNGSHGAPLLALGRNGICGKNQVPSRVELERVGLFWEDSVQATELSGCLAGSMQMRISADTVSTAQAAASFLDGLHATNPAAAAAARERMAASAGGSATGGGVGGPDAGDALDTVSLDGMTDEQACVAYPQLCLAMAVVRHCPPPPPRTIDDPLPPQPAPGGVLGADDGSAEAPPERTEAVKAALRTLLSALERRSAAGRGGGLLMVTAQPPLEVAMELRTKRYLTSQGNTTATWTAGDQRKFKRVTMRANLGAVSFAAVE
jgi:DNA polymerase III epsilon subunit-like protein